MTSFNFNRLATIGIMVAIGLSHGARAQLLPAFEAASIRRNPGVDPNTRIGVSGGRLTIRNASPKTLIRNAYDILSFQLAGAPRWLDTEMYDIVATTGGSERIPPDRLKLLLQHLLADRFRLKVHWETREAPVYALVQEKNGPKFHESAGVLEPGINTRKEPGRVQMEGSREPMSILASNLGNQLGRIVMDRTGLRGAYDWALEWSPDLTVDSSRPSLFTALQEQLGLRLEAQKGTMEILIVDSVERPSEN